MGSTGAFGQARLAAGLGVVALLVVGCSATMSGSAVRDSTAVLPASTAGASDWSTAEPPTTTERRPPTTSAAATSSRPRATTGTGRPVGDLGLTEIISQVPCDGRVIVLLGSATTPSAYASEVQQLLQVHPGSHYLRTDQACSSLAQRSDDGHPIYAAFYGPYGETSKACEVLRLTGGNAQVRVLTDSERPLGREHC